MKPILKLFVLATVTAFALSSCQKDFKYAEGSFELEIFGETADFTFASSAYSSIIEVPLERADDFDFYTSGVIKYELNGVEIGKVDFGNGEKDTWAKKEVDGKETDLDLTKKDGKSDYNKKIIKPLVKTTDCDYIVEGTIEYWREAKWVATVDFGDGTCDDLATKQWEDGTKEFSMSKK